MKDDDDDEDAKVGEAGSVDVERVRDREERLGCRLDWSGCSSGWRETDEERAAVRELWAEEEEEEEGAGRFGEGDRAARDSFAVLDKAGLSSEMEQSTTDAGEVCFREREGMEEESLGGGLGWAL